MTDGADTFRDNVQQLLSKLSISTEDIKNMTISALLFKIMGSAEDENVKNSIQQLMGVAKSVGLENETPRTLGIVGKSE